MSFYRYSTKCETQRLLLKYAVSKWGNQPGDRT